MVSTMANLASAEHLASVEWSISLTSHLLLRSRAGLASRRPVLERRLRRFLAHWRGGGVLLTALFAWRDHAREMRGSIALTGLRRLHAAASRQRAQARVYELLEHARSNVQLSRLQLAWQRWRAR